MLHKQLNLAAKESILHTYCRGDTFHKSLCWVPLPVQSETNRIVTEVCKEAASSFRCKDSTNPTLKLLI